MATTVKNTTNTVTITEATGPSVTVTNNVSNASTTITTNTAPTITISSPGPKGDTGAQGSVSGFSGTLTGQHINLSGALTASAGANITQDLYLTDTSENIRIYMKSNNAYNIFRSISKEEI